MKLLGISGKAGAGKDTAAEFFHDEFLWDIYHFADPLKAACSAAFGIPLNHFSDRELKEKNNSYWNASPREIAQLVGTELFRERWDPNFWVRRAGMEVARLQSSATYNCQGLVIPDVRFQNEADWIIQQGGFVLNIHRPSLADTGSVGVANHASEAGFCTTDYGARYVQIINDGSLDQLYRALTLISSII